MTMEDKPAAAVRKKKDCSIARAIELVDEGKADAVISLGNTGGIFAAATFKLGRIPGVDRGGIATVIPTPDNRFCPARFRREHRMQADSSGALCRHGEHLFARSLGLQKSPRRDC